MLPPDGVTLDEIIGDLQSEFGVPQSPQEFRITLRVGPPERDRDQGAPPAETRAEPKTEDEDAPGVDRPRREKAPAAPRVAVAETGAAPARRKRRRRRRGRGGGGSGAPGANPPG